MAKVKIGNLKANFMANFKEFLEGNGEEVLLVKSGTYSIPWVLEGEEGYINVTFSVPTGARDGEGYDGHEEAQNFTLERANKDAEKAKRDEAKARDTALRAKKRKPKPKRLPSRQGGGEKIPFPSFFVDVRLRKVGLSPIFPIFFAQPQ